MDAVGLVKNNYKINLSKGQEISRGCSKKSPYFVLPSVS
jgi:hypothetical protein